MKDPARVEMRVPGASSAVIAAGAPPGTEATLAKGTLATSDRTSAAYTITARRDENGGITLVTDTRVPLGNGENLTVIGANGRLSGLYDGDESPRIDLTTPEFVLPLCGDLARSRYSHYVTLGTSCSDQPEYRVDLTTPWSNVKSVTVQRRAWGRGFFSAMAGLAAVSLIVPGTVVLIAGKGSGSTNIIGGATVAAGVIVVLPLLPPIFESDQDTVLYPR
jgi:hypothetical protein